MLQKGHSYPVYHMNYGRSNGDEPSVLHCMYADKLQYVSFQDTDFLHLLSWLPVLTCNCQGSPLHGILAGIELIQDSQLTAFQQEMAQSVALAGRTLLDTVDHILDYSKISNLTRGQKRDRAKVDSLRHQITDDVHTNGLVSVDLARLTEEVVEGAISAHRHSRRLLDVSSETHHTVSVTLDVEKRDSWITAMTPGTWVRILNNILGKSIPDRMVTCSS